ncbi:MAG: RNA polymerase factor sigma-54, partial [Verrucomicrobiota bacterium]
MSSQGLTQVQKQTQSLVLAPQLRQSLRILQVPAMELRNEILEELQTNPLLEESAQDGPSIEDQISDRNETTEPESNDGEMDFKEDYDILNKLDEDWREYFAQENNNNVHTSDDAERRQHFFDSYVAETSLQEHLLQQIEMSECDEDEVKALQFLIGSIDERGFISSSISDIALMANLPLKTAQRAHEMLKTFDPPGIGAVDLQDCLKQQLKARGRTRTLAWAIVSEHFNLLLRRRIPEMAKKLGVSADEVQEAIVEIAQLDPSPGRKFSDDSNRVVTPDVKVEKDDDGNWQIILNNDYIPRLRLSSVYKELIAKGQIKGKEKEYVQEKMRSGKFLISSIEQRQQTIERITREILNFQTAFFEQGVSKLRPLTMNQVAEKVGVHETTVSRAIANKFIDTPFGVFEIKYFFTPGYTG